MSKYLVDDFDLTYIADKIRESSGTSKDLVFPYEFVNNIKVCYEERPSVFEFNITSELTQTLHFTQSEPNAVLIDWGDGSPAESFIGTKSSLDPLHPEYYEYYVNDAAHTFRFPGKYLVSFNVKKNRTWKPGTGSIGFSFLGYALFEKSPSNPALISINIGDGVSNILDDIQFNGATGLEYAHFCQNRAKGSVVPTAIQTSTAIKNLIFGRNIQSMGASNTFNDCTSIERLELGLQINDLIGAFSGCTGLKEVYIKSTSTPRYDDNTFKNVSTEIPFYVQRDLLEKYKSIGFYKKFNLQPYDF